MLQVRLNLEASGKATRKKLSSIYLLTVRWKVLCATVHSISTMTVHCRQQCEAFASNRLEDFLNVREVAINRLVVYDVERDLQ